MAAGIGWGSAEESPGYLVHGTSLTLQGWCWHWWLHLWPSQLPEGGGSWQPALHSFRQSSPW